MIDSVSTLFRDRPIVFLDSGVGGLPYLERAREILPGWKFLYVADRENFPYGDRSPQDVRRVVLKVTGEIVQRLDPLVIVIACNTASVVALDAVRQEFSLPIVGVVPAVKPAAEISLNRRIGVLATHRTVEDRYVLDLIQRFASDCSIIKVAGGDIVEFVEQRFFQSSQEERTAIVAPSVLKFREAMVDTVVLGCTHFLHIRSELVAGLGFGITVVDSREGVARQLERVLLPVPPEISRVPVFENRSDAMYITGKAGLDGTVREYKSFAGRFGLVYAGTL